MKHKMPFQIALFFFLLGAVAVQLLAEPVATRVLVRAVSRDAKIIGTGVGGAKITIRDAVSGKLLAEGVQEGATVNTDLIMVKPRERGAVVYDTKNAAGFLATLELEQPTTIEIVAEGPLGTPQSTQRTSKTLLVVPGKDILGEGVLLEIHGFTVTLVKPERTQFSAGESMEVRATVRMT